LHQRAALPDFDPEFSVMRKALANREIALVVD
jgi:hypothetical protein